MSMLDIAIKASVLLLIAALAAGVGRRYAAAHRHFIWMLMMKGLGVLPILTFVSPFRLPGVPRCVVRRAWCVGTAPDAAAPIVQAAAASVSGLSDAPRTTHDAP